MQHTGKAWWREEQIHHQYKLMTYSFQNFQVSVFITNVKYWSFHWNEDLVPLKVTLSISVIAHKIWMTLIILLRMEMCQTIQNFPATEITP